MALSTNTIPAVFDSSDMTDGIVSAMSVSRLAALLK